MEMNEARYREGVLRSYEGKGIIAHWEPSLCIHVAACIRALPETFVPDARPWIAIDTATAEEIQAAILQCPTGALRYTRTDGQPQEQPDIPTTVQPRLNGPLFVRGEVEVVDAQERTTRIAARLALCRCGASRNKPYCDLSHRAIGFRS